MTGPADDRRAGSDGDPGSPRGGPALRTDVIDVYIFRAMPTEPATVFEALQLRRVGAPLDRTWQPVMGHIEPGETAAETALRELREEVGLAASGPELVGLWALEQVWPFYLAELDAIVLSPRFAARVDPGWEPTLNEEHDGARWIRFPLHGGQPASEFFMWPGQRHALDELSRIILPESSPGRDALRIPLPGRGGEQGR